MPPPLVLIYKYFFLYIFIDKYGTLNRDRTKRVKASRSFHHTTCSGRKGDAESLARRQLEDGSWGAGNTSHLHHEIIVVTDSNTLDPVL